MEVILSKEFRFEAAHFLPMFPKEHKCRRLHGHSFLVEIKVFGPVDPELGILMDFGDIKKVVTPFIDMLDHHCLNDLGKELGDPLLSNPSSENMAIWLYQKIKPLLPNIHSLKVEETCTTSCELICPR